MKRPWNHCHVSLLAVCIFLFHLVQETKLDVVESNKVPHITNLQKMSLQAETLKLTFKNRVFAVDSQLHQLARQYVDQEFVHPKAQLSNLTQNYGPKMINPKLLASATNITINVVNPCNGNLGKDVTLLVMVYNRASDLKRRQAIRDTFGSKLKANPKTAIYFIIAKNGNQIQLENEARVYNDIIQIDYQENYYNCTIKSVAMLRWTALYCPYTQYLLKFDDDSFMRVNQLLTELDMVGLNNHILGTLRTQENPMRSSGQKWTISPQYYPYDTYPPYHTGVFFIPGYLTACLYEAITSRPQMDTIPALPFEDVYITGILAQKVNIPLKQLPFMYEAITSEPHLNTIHDIKSEHLPFIYLKYDVVLNMNEQLFQRFSLFVNWFTVADQYQMWQIEIGNFTLKNRILNVDNQLHELGRQYVDKEFVHPKATFSNTTQIGPKMINPKLLASATNITINVVNPCNGNMGKDMTLLVMVHNRASDFERRQTIRDTFGSELKSNPKTAIYFIIAKNGNQSQLENEARVYNDIIQIDYQENYYNCTIKSVAMLRWTALYCPYTQYLLKFDDDSYMRVNQLLADLNRVNQNYQILGILRPDPPVIRSPESKYYISPQYYPYQNYPTFHQACYIIPGHFAMNLYEAITEEPQIDTIPVLPFEAAYITGILAQKARIPRISFPFIYLNQETVPKVYFNVFPQYSIFFNLFNVDWLHRLWQMEIGNFTLHDKILEVDNQLHELARQYVDKEFVHPKATFSNTTQIGPKMINPKLLASATNIAINVVNPCNGNMGKDMTLLVMMYNRASDLKRRQAIRDTFGSKLKANPKTALYFIIAKEGNQTLLEQEAIVYNDIIQIDYQENYFNCTIKGVAMLRWTALYCPKVKYLLKFDDDSFMRVNQLLVELESVRQNNHILGKLAIGSLVVRDQTIKWYISEQYYPYITYPNYLPGIFFISGQHALALYQAVISEPTLDTIPALPFDDAYITGILALKAAIPLEDVPFIFWNVESPSKLNKTVFLGDSVFVSMFTADDLHQAWNVVRNDTL